MKRCQPMTMHQCSTHLPEITSDIYWLISTASLSMATRLLPESVSCCSHSRRRRMYSVLLPARRCASAGTSCGPVSVCLSVCLSEVGILSKRQNESSCFLACELPSTHPTPSSKEILVSTQNKGISLWNFVPNSALRKFCHGISFVQRVINLARSMWTLRAW